MGEIRKNAWLRDRYRGVLLGKAVGDALGATVEFMSRDEIRARYGRPTEITGGGWLNLEAGEITDDTQMTMCIARSIVERGGWDPDDVARRFVDWYHSRPPDIGNTTRMSLQFLADGVPWHEAGQRTHEQLRPRDASNGSVMRCAPVALLARADAEVNARYSAESSVITHANPISVQASIAQNAAIAALLDDPASDPVQAAMDAVDHDETSRWIASASNIGEEELNSGGYALATLQSSLWAVTRFDSLEDAVIAAVNLGDDADTTGAVAGALAGAKWGAGAIPERWLSVLKPREELIELADGLLQLSLAGD